MNIRATRSLLSLRIFIVHFLLGVVLMVPQAFGQSADSGLAGLVQLLKATHDEATQQDVLRGMKAALNGRRGVVMPPGWPAIERLLAKSVSSDTQLLSQSLGLVFGSQFALESLRSTLVGVQSSVPVRKAAMTALLSVKEPGLPAILRPLLAESAMRADAIRALAAFNDDATPGALLGVYSQLNAIEQRDALNTLASRLSYARPLLAAVKAEKVAKSHITADLVRQIRNLKDATLSSELEKIWGIARETTADKAKEIEKYRRVYAAGGSTPGDGSRGRKVFAKICQQCHTLFDVGGNVGPDLTGSNRADLEYLLSNILDPNAVIPNDYRSSTVETKDDRVLTGIVKQQDGKTVTIQTANETLVISRDDVSSISLSPLSMMPEGLLTGLLDQEIRDLIYYMGRPGQVP